MTLRQSNYGVKSIFIMHCWNTILITHFNARFYTGFFCQTHTEYNNIVMYNHVLASQGGMCVLIGGGGGEEGSGITRGVHVGSYAPSPYTSATFKLQF